MRLDGLHAPYGANLAVLLETDKQLYRLADGLFQEKGFRLVINSDTYELGMVKEVEGRLCIFSYQTISETLRRIVFFMAILHTNQGAILLLDEPEANTYPFYTAHMAESIALDESNQYFISTHNPYILGSIVGKTPVKDLAVFVTTMEGYRTCVKRVPDDKLPLILDYGQDAFVNLDKLVES
jgi:predicted ATPase